MSLVEIIIIIIAIVCFFEWDELRHNNIRNDENKYFVIGVLLMLAFFILLYITHTTINDVPVDE